LKFLFFGGHDDFSAEAEWYFVLTAKFNQQVIASNAVFSLQTSWFIIYARMNHIAVIARLVIGYNRFFFNNEYLKVLILGFQLQSCGETYCTTTHNDYIVLHGQFFL
jgi:hypothetical protein